jgi:tryptophanyl-tRNA synthetase
MRDIAQKFNADYKTETFPLPEPLILGAATRVMSLRDGTKKMSKSDESDYSRINMTDDADAIAQKLKKAKTDPHPLPDSVGAMEERPEAANLLGIWAALSDTTVEDAVGRFAGKQFSAFKGELTDLAVAVLTPIAREMKRLLADPASLDAVLRRGGEQARGLSAPILSEIKRVVGFLPA